MKTNTIEYKVFQDNYNGMQNEIFSVSVNNKLVYDRDYGSLTKSVEEYIEDYKKWESAPTIAMRNADVYDAVNNALKCLESFRSNIDGETINYIVKQMGYEANLKNWKKEFEMEDKMRLLFDVYYRECQNRRIEYTACRENILWIVMDGIELSYMEYEGVYQPIFMCSRYSEVYGHDVYYFKTYAECKKVWDMDEEELTQYIKSITL